MLFQAGGNRALLDAFLWVMGFLIVLCGCVLCVRRAVQHVSEWKSPCGDDDLSLGVFRLSTSSVMSPSSPGLRLIGDCADQASKLNKLRAYLSFHFDEAEALLSSPRENGSLSKVSRNGVLQVRRNVFGDEFELEVLSRETARNSGLEALDKSADLAEIHTLREVVNQTNALLWKQGTGGEVLWANSAYFSAMESSHGEQVPRWPVPNIFERVGGPSKSRSHNTVGDHSVDVKQLGDIEYWLQSTRIDGGQLVTGYPLPETFLNRSLHSAATESLEGEIASHGTLFGEPTESNVEWSEFQMVLDFLDDAVVLFGADGRLVHQNLSYTQLWPKSVGSSQVGQSFVEEIMTWRDASFPSPAWNQIEDYAREGGDGQLWSARVQLLDGRNVACRLVPFKSGGALLLFR